MVWITKVIIGDGFRAYVGSSGSSGSCVHRGIVRGGIWAVIAQWRWLVDLASAMAVLIEVVSAATPESRIGVCSSRHWVVKAEMARRVKSSSVLFIHVKLLLTKLDRVTAVAPKYLSEGESSSQVSSSFTWGAVVFSCEVVIRNFAAISRRLGW